MTTPATESPVPFSRDPETGLVNGVVYPRLPNGKIDWRALLNPAHIVFRAPDRFNPSKAQLALAAEIEKAYGAPVQSLVYADVAAKQPVDDKHILVLLAGFQELAELRGYSSSIPSDVAIGRSLRKRSPDVSYRDIEDTIVSTSWQIDWIPNVEEPHGKTSGGVADATYENTGDFGYLSAMSGNRAFVRAVKSGLGIRILGFDEIAKKDDAIPEAGANFSVSSVSSSPNFSLEPVEVLKKTASECGYSFASIRNSAIKHYKASIESGSTQLPYTSDPEKWTRFEDVAKLDCAGLIGAIRKGKENAEKKKAGK